jgi:Integrase core domain
VPFATITLARLTQLSVWRVRLGLVPECIEPGKPHQNDRDERLPRTLKAETTRPPGANLCAQQQSNGCREEFNHQRPPKAHDMCPPPPAMNPLPGRRPTNCHLSSILTDAGMGLTASPCSATGHMGPVYGGSGDVVRVRYAPQPKRRLQIGSRKCLPDVGHTASHLAVGSKTYPPLDAHISSNALSGVA